MTADTTPQPMQEFRCRSTNKVLEIAAHIHSETGNRVVLWDDIKAGFNNADSIRNGRSPVPFLRDTYLKEIIPRRIAYHPGTVLDIILDEHSRGRSHSHSHGYSLSHDHNQLSSDASSTDTTPSRAICHDTSCNLPATMETATCTLPVSVSLVDSNTDNSHVPYSLSVDGSCSSSVIVSGPQSNPSLREVMSAQVDLKAVVQQSFDPQSNQIQALQDQLTLTSDKLSKTTAELVKRQEEMNEMQKRALDRLANIQSRVQAVVTRTYELHEHPIPRLFIVLPKDSGVLGKLSTPFAQQFRLYFLCECGAHTMDENSMTPHKIHFAKHEGYDLEKPNEFFERYGPYILTLMNMIKYGITAESCVVSPLSSLKIAEGIDTVQEHMFVKENIAPLVDSTIDFLDDFKRKTDPVDELTEGHKECDQLEALEGADLRQLESYLKVKDKGRVLANLYRIVTTEGHVKWVCFDHYKSIHRQSAVQHLREIVQVNRGTFIEETGKVEIKIATGTLADEFYDAMIKAQWVQELEITLEWDAMMSDLRSLANAVTKANVFYLTVDGSCFKSPPLDVANNSQRFNPILKLASSSQTQSLRLNGFDDFFSHVTKSSIAPASRLRIFKYDAPFASKGKDFQRADDFLGYCSALTTLEINLPPQHSILRTTFKILGKFQTLESLKVSQEDVMVIAGNRKTRIQDADMSMQLPAVFVLDGSKAIQNEHLTWMTIRNLPKNEVDRLADVLRSAPNLKHLRIGCGYEGRLAVIDRVISTRERIIQDTGSYLRTFELMEGDLAPFSTSPYHLSDHTQSYMSFQDGSNIFDMRTSIRHGGDSALDFVRRYGWSIAFYDGGFQTNISCSDILNGFGDTKTPQLQSLRIRSSMVDAAIMDQIIRRSPNFKDLGLCVNLNEEVEFKVAQTLLSRFGPILSGLNLWHGKFEEWSWFASSLPTRRSLPTLESFGLDPGHFDLPSKCIPWIVAMVSAPPPPPQEPIPPSQPIIQDVIDKQVPHAKSVAQRSWTSLKRIELDCLKLLAGEWKSVIEAIDLSELQTLSFNDSNLPVEGLRLLVNRIPNYAPNLPLEILDIRQTHAERHSASRSLLGTLRRKAPLVTIVT
ncbi:hypothetical protein B0O80DRAFT_532011 [Mortierella sp. GBAus27b]|nr:hypothetical protein B0O80DRAFT_532011 [Mortierella sp. GBAus27b]